MPAAMTLPIISIAPYTNPLSPSSSRLITSQSLHSACRDIGFFYLRIDDLDFITKDEAVDVITMGREFFGRPEEEKVQIALENSDGARGYQKMNQNITQGLSDHHEGLDFYAPSPYPEGTKSSHLPLSGENQWPSKPEEFKQIISSWMSKMKILGMLVMRAMADGLQMTLEEWEELKSKIDDSFWVMRVIGYPPLPQGAEGISCGAHKDYGCLTLLHTDPTPQALQVFLRPKPDAGVENQASEDEGTWIDANPMEGCVVVNVGEMWEIWSNGLYKSTLHRVIHRSPTYRVSLPFFYEPAFDAFIEPLESAKRVQAEEGWKVGKKVYKGVKYGDFLIGKVGGNFVREEGGGGERQGRY